MKCSLSSMFPRLIATFLLLFLATPLALGGVSQEVYVKGSTSAFRNELGASVAISGNTMVVGVPGGEAVLGFFLGIGTIPPANILGSVYVFERSGGVWTQQAVLQASNARLNDHFGCAVAISGDTIVVGAKGETSNASGVNGDQADTSVPGAGAAYVFVRSGTTWSQQAYLKSSNPGIDDSFGNAVAISGDTVVVGADFERSNATGVNGDDADDSFFAAGAAYVFARSGTTWSQQAYLKPSNTHPLFYFGHAVAIENETIVVGANREWSNATGVNGNQADTTAEGAGAAYIFVRDGTVWTQQAYLKASNTEATDQFGRAVAISDNTVVIGAQSEDSQATGGGGNQADNSETDSGAAYVFTRSGTTWSQQAYLKASNTDNGDLFGASVAISGDTILVGAPLESSGANGIDGDQADNSFLYTGAAYLFTRHSGTWSQQAYLKASHSTVGVALLRGDRFGSSVAISDDSLLVGAPFEGSSSTGINSTPDLSDSFSAAGAAYLFQFTQTDPSAVTLAASSMTPDSAVLNGRINAGLNPTTMQFEYAESAAGPFTSVPVPGTFNGGSDTFPSVVVTGLEQGTTYFFRALASNLIGSSTGDLLSFTTPFVLPVLTVDGATAGLIDIHDGGSSYPHHFTESGGELYFVAADAAQGLLLHRVTAGGSEVVADVNGSNPDNSGYSNLTDVNGVLHFTADDAVHGTELWKLGPSGPVLVADINPGTASSYPNGLTVINGVLYFSAETAANGHEIWHLPPTGTPTLTEVQPGTDGSYPDHLTPVGNRLFFSASETSVGTELWYLNDAFEAVLVDDDVMSDGGLATSDDSIVIGEMLAVEDALYFSTTAGFLSSERKLWRVLTSGGTASEAELLFTTTATPTPFGSPGFPYPANFTRSGSAVYFTGLTPEAGNTLWKVPGALSPAELVASLTQPGSLTDLNGTLYFAGEDGALGSKLWRTTPTGVESLDVSFPNALTVANGQLFFNGTDDTHGQELWRILADGSPAIVADASPGTDSSTLFQMVAIGRRIFLTLATAGEGLELWTLDSQGIPRLVEGSRVSSTNGSNPDSLTVFQDVLYFQADDGVHGSELWHTINVMPTVTVPAGETASCTGMIDRALEVPGLTLAASIGTVTFDAAAGTWSWTRPNATLPDAGEIIITASNSTQALATVRFNLVVVGDALSYADWAASHGLIGPDADPGTSLPNDGVTNLLRYAFNIIPSLNSPAAIDPGTGVSGMPSISRVNTPGGTVFRYEFIRRSGSALVYTPKISTDLIDWVTLTSSPAIIPIDADWERVIQEIPATATRLFGRVEVEL